MKKFTTLFLVMCVAVLSFAGCSTSLERKIEKKSKNLTNYYMDINYDNYSLNVNQTIDYVNSSDVNFDKIYLHLYANNFSYGATNSPVSALNTAKAYPNGFSEGNIKINGLSVDGEMQSPKISGQDYDILEVEVGKLAPLDRVEISLSYVVTIPNCLHRFGYGDNTINVANFYPIVAVYDGEWNLDSYHSNGDPFYSDVANYYVNITAPTELTLAHTGDEQSQSQANNVTTYEITAKVVRDFAFVLSDKFSVAHAKCGDVDVKYYYYDDDNFSQSLQSAVDSISTFNKLFGEYPYKSYSVVKSNFIHGGMELPNLVLISDSVSDYNDYVNVIIHETAHQWWYGVVGNNEFDYGWLDEGLTDYSTALFYKYNPSYGVDFEQIMKNTTNSYVNFVEVYTKILGSVDTTMNRSLNEYDTEPEYVYMAYVKGALLFESLRESVGEEKFLAVMQKYYKDYEFSNVTPDDLVGEFEKYLGYGMQGFFSSWIDGKVVIKRMD